MPDLSDIMFRLAGDGDRHSGGAIPLPDAFSAVVNYLVDYGNADMRKLTQLVSDALAYKEERIMAAAWRSWEQFTRDILGVLTVMELVKENQFSRWELTSKFIQGHVYHLPGTDIPFVGRSAAERERWHHNELLHLALTPVFAVIRDKATNADPLARTLVLEAEKVLVRELKLDQQHENENTVSRYRQKSPRKPGDEGKRLRKGMTGFYRDDFWSKYATPGVWYDLATAARKFEELYPNQPRISHSGDLLGSMRKAARDLVTMGVLEQRRVHGEGSAWKHEFRMKTDNPEFNVHPGTIMEVKQTTPASDDGWGGESDPKE